MRSKTFSLLVAAVLLIFAAMGLLAQDEAPACDYAAVGAELTNAAEQLVDAESPDTLVIDLTAYLSNFTAQCGGLVFTDDTGSSQVIGPVEIPEGIYRTTFTTEGFGSVKLTNLEGKCGEGQYFVPGLFIISQGQAVNGAEKVAQSEGCSTLIEVSNVQSLWELRFEKLQ